MAIYKVRAPDGSIVTVRGPDGASEQEVMEQAQRLYAQQQQPQQQAPASAPADLYGGELPAEPKTVGQHAKDALGFTGEVVGGAADLGATVLSSAIGQPLAGLAGAVAGVATGDWENTAPAVTEQAKRLLTWSPKSKGAQNILGTAGQALEPIMQTMQDVVADPRNPVGRIGRMIGGEKGQAAAQAGLQTAIEAAPSILVGSKVPKPKAQPTMKLKDAEAAAENLGINLSNNKIRESVRTVGDRLSGERDEGLTAVAEAVKAKAREAKKGVRKAWDESRKTTAQVKYAPIKEMVSRVEQNLIDRGFAIEGETFKILDSLKQIDKRIPGVRGVAGRRKSAVGEELPEGLVILGPDAKPLRQATEFVNPDIPLTDLYRVYHRVNKSLRAAGRNKDADYAALSQLKDDIKTHIDNQFDNDMISGDPQALAKWKAANEASTEWSRLFRADRQVAKMIQNEADPETIAKWLLGTNQVRKKSEAAATVRKIKEILGDDAPEIGALRDATLGQLFTPLLAENPGFAALATNIKKFLTQNPTLVKELGIDVKELDLFRRAAHSASKAVTQKEIDMKGLLAQAVTRFTVGHEIAKAGMHVRLWNMALDRVLGIGQKTHDQLLKEFAEAPKNPLFDRNKPEFRKFLAISAAQAMAEDADEPVQEW